MYHRESHTECHFLKLRLKLTSYILSKKMSDCKIIISEQSFEFIEYLINKSEWKVSRIMR